MNISYKLGVHKLAFLLLVVMTYVEGIMYHLQPSTQKCLREELGINVLISGEYEVSEAPGQRIDYVVTDSKGHIFSQKEDVTKGKFSFISETYDTFEICFISRPVTVASQRPVLQEVSLVIKTGIEAKSYEGLAEVSKLKPMEVELKRLEDLSDSIVADFAEMKKREEEMSNTNESTNYRVFYLSIVGVTTLFGLATWQVLYLRKYFKTKKLID